jgi:hypothetical protein
MTMQTQEIIASASAAMQQSPALALRSAIPAPGVYRNVPASEYHAWPGCSASRLSVLADATPLHYRYAIDNPTEPTDAMRLGSLLHAGVLEPETVLDKYAIAPKCDRRTKEGKAAWVTFCRESDGKTVVTSDEVRAVRGMVKAVRSHPLAAELLEHRTETELSVVWIDPTTGVRCKMRMDALCGRIRIVLDLKSTEDASPDAFSHSVWKWGYHRQGAHYLAGLAAHGIDAEAFTLIVPEKTPPHAVAVYELTDEALQAGREEIAVMLRTIAECERTKKWPGYGDGCARIGIPEWVTNRKNRAALAADEQEQGPTES